ncbi:MAG: IPT/TIG domain-containing protein, partial [Chitinophagaceae bacterium]|nr:IPT/TIG domain-containing protein [Chitinophagaceae bacterium]
QQINMVVDAFDNVTVTWMESVGSVVVIQSARFSAAPIISSISPNQGPATGGTTITITGANFNNVLNVFFGTQAASFEVSSNTQITAISPPGNGGVVDITVVTSNGISPISSNARFTYLQPSPPPPSAIPLPPTDLKGFQILKRKGRHLDVVNILTWDPPSQQSSPIIAYRIYSGNKLVGTVPSDRPLRFVQHHKKWKRYTYAVVSVDPSGRESSPVFVTIHRAKHFKFFPHCWKRRPCC